jgi:class 3 adenylate cyclase/tetratricopeptide (TPR) repeat protein
MNCPNCGFANPANLRFCGSCGTRLTTTCPECGFANPLDFRFCGMCGTRLNTESAPPVIEQPALLPATEAEPLLPAATPPLEGERRVVTVVFSDLTDSTNLLEQIGTEGWVELMNRILHILESEIYRFGGEISQFRGDGLVAFFGATVAHEDDPERAVLAALSMQRAFDLYVREQLQPEAADLRMRVGVNTGEVIAAVGGDRQQWQEAAMGMAVAVAARMEAAAEPGTVLVSEHTHRLVELQFDWQPLGEISVKGVRQPITVYRPHRHITELELVPHGETFPETMPRIGREAEFHILKACVEGLFEGRGGIATLTGDKGSGKSFLLSEVRQYFAHREALLAETSGAAPAITENSLAWVRGRCRSYSQTWPYSMWLDLFRDWLGIRPDDSKEEQLACLRRRAEELWGEDLAEHYPYLATFLGFPLEETFTEKVRHLESEGLRQRFFLAVRSWIEAASRRSPVVLAFSDMQWVDDSSLDLLRYCLSICDSESLLWMLSFRPEREASIWKFHNYVEAEYPHRLTNIELLPLTPTQSSELINHLVGPETLPDETRELIIRNAGGNPFYMLELIRALIDQGVLARETADSPWRLTRPITTLDMPGSLQRLLLTRIDRLSVQQRMILQIASVIGPLFWLNMLVALLDEPQTLRTDLAALQRSQLIQESGRVPELGMQYFFKSPLIRETAYDSLLSSHRIAYHLQAAQYLEDMISPDILANYDGMLAYHYREAGNVRKELFYTFLAAEHERMIYANAEALQDYTRAMELLDKLEATSTSKGQIRSIQAQRFEVLNGRRHVYFQLGQIQAGRADTQALLPLAREMADDPVWLIDALTAQAGISRDSRQELTPGLHMAEEALALAQQLGDEQRVMRSLTRVANIRFTLNDPSWRELAERALRLARRLGDLRTEVNLLLAIGGKYGMDDLPRGREYLQEALSRSETLNDKATKLPLLNAIGQQLERDGDYYRQLTEYEQVRLRLSREIGNRIAEGNALMFCGQIQALYLGDYEKGLELELQTLNFWENINDRLFPLLRIAQVQTALGRHTEALATLEMARPLQEEVVFDVGRAGFGLVTVILYNALGDRDRLQSGLEISSQIQQMAADNLVSHQYHMAAACESAAAHLKLAQNFSGRKRKSSERQAHLAQALESSQSALDLYQQFGFVQVVECTSEEILYRHSLALAANDRAEEANSFLHRAHEEMLRKYDLIPADSPFRKTFLENIELHREIQVAYAAQNTRPAPPLTASPSNQNHSR